METLSQEDLESLAQGTALLGGGGGGSLAAARMFIPAIAQAGGVTITSEAPAGEGCVLADIGANSSIEAGQVKAIENCMALMTAQRGGKGFTCLYAVETGPENTLAPMVYAALHGLPVFDGDGAGRAVPEIPLCSYAVSGIPVDPLAIANDGSDAVVAFAQDSADMDALLRPITAASQFGGSASMALWAADNAQLSNAAIPGTISYALALGRFLQAMRAGDRARAEALVPMLNARQACVLGIGKVTAINSNDNGAFDLGSVVVQPAHGGPITVLTQNENLIAYSADHAEPLAVAPHSICYLRQGWDAITNAELKVGDRLALIGVSALAPLATPTLLARFGTTLRGLGFGGRPGTFGHGLQPTALGTLLFGMNADLDAPKGLPPSEAETQRRAELEAAGFKPAAVKA